MIYMVNYNSCTTQDLWSCNWWLNVQGWSVGYWPLTLFGYLRHSATLVERWSVQLTCKESATHGDGHGGVEIMQRGITSTQAMWSSQGSWTIRCNWSGTWANEPFCYSADNYQRTYTTEPVFFYGGPGRNRDCH